MRDPSRVADAFEWRWCGTVPYDLAAREMHAAWARRRDGRGPDTLLLLEHPSTFTIGRHGSLDDILTPAPALGKMGFAVHKSDRGGRVTYHGPGQLVAYPIFAVPAMGAGRFVSRLAEVMRALTATVGIESSWDSERPGVWVEGKKIGAVGVRVESGVSRHGFALNIAPDLSHYRHIVPCGLSSLAVTSLRALGRECSVAAMAQEAVAQFARAFSRDARPMIGHLSNEAASAPR